RTLPARDRYKLLISVVVPRPIALVTSLDENGVLNAAPFSFFNVVGSDPALVILGVGDRAPHTPKDTAHNIASTGEFVVNLVDENLAEQMNICSIDFPAGISEVEAAKLETAPSTQIKTPRLLASPVSLECRQHTRLEIGRNRLIIGEVMQLHIRDELIDEEKLYVRTEAMHAVGRMHGGGWYTKTDDQFLIPRQSYEEWREGEARE
ncbi:MAG TPA: flavin reductase family protein, partial [Abditibacteriaceae bacterium]